MRIAVIGAGVAGLVAALAARAGRARLRRLRALARARRPGGDARRRRRATCSSATTTTCSRATATSRPSTTSSGCRTSSSGGRRSVAFFAEGRVWPFTTPLDLLRFRRCAALARVRMGLAVLRLQRAAARSSRSRARPRAPGSARDGRAGVGEGLGAAAARQVRRPRRRHLDGVAVEQADAAPADQGRARRARSCSATRGARWEPLFEELQRAIEARRRAGADRPPGGAAGARRTARFAVTRGRARLVPAPATTRARFERRRRAERYDAVRRDRPERRLQQPARPRARAREVGDGYLARLARSSTTPRSACCSSSTGRSRRSTGRTSPTRAAVRRADRAHELRRARALRRPALPLRRQLPRRRRTSCSRSTPRSCSTATSRGCGGSTRRSRAAGSSERWLFREPAAQPIVTVGYRERIPPLATGVAGLLLANTTQIYPEDRGTNYTVRLGEQAAAAMLGRC